MYPAQNIAGWDSYVHHFMAGAGILRGIFRVNDLSQVIQQISGKAGNILEIFLSPRPNAAILNLRVCLKAD